MRRNLSKAAAPKRSLHATRLRSGLADRLYRAHVKPGDALSRMLSSVLEALPHPTTQPLLAALNPHTGAMSCPRLNQGLTFARSAIASVCLL